MISTLDPLVDDDFAMPIVAPASPWAEQPAPPSQPFLADEFVEDGEDDDLTWDEDEDDEGDEFEEDEFDDEDDEDDDFDYDDDLFEDDDDL